MKIGKTTVGITAEERAAIADLPAAPNAYLEMPKLSVEPGTGAEGEVYYNTTDEKFYLYEDEAWVEALFCMIKVTP
ncbi:unnamed protein product [marine sediment metagenome]|uniref:Uncharacterized protein n=1 Tax=marine sediment metagenome TaxID=412755 RepID=X1UTE4_9ZZZZ